jgi:hypothetical protein
MRIYRWAALLAAALSVAGCVGSQPALDRASASSMLDGPVPPGMARLYVIAGKAYSENRTPEELDYTFLVSVDGIKVAKVRSEEAVAIDLPAGLHVVNAFRMSMYGDLGKSTMTDLGNVSAGQRIYVVMNHVEKTNYNITRGTQLEGSLVGFAADVAADAILRDPSHNAMIPHQQTGDYLDLTQFGRNMLAYRTLVAADDAAVSRLSAPKS